MSDNVPSDPAEKPAAGIIMLLVVSWLWVGIPLAWGVSQTIETSMVLFRNPLAATTK